MEKEQKMTVADIIGSEQFKNNVSKIINELNKVKREAADAGRLNRSTFGRLEERNAMNVEIIQRNYAAILNKNLTGYSSTERKLIKAIGDRACIKTIQFINQSAKVDEKA